MSAIATASTALPKALMPLYVPEVRNGVIGGRLIARPREAERPAVAVGRLWVIANIGRMSTLEIHEDPLDAKARRDYRERH
jgi:hypothetical protein